MGYEIEIKAHVAEDDYDRVKDALFALPDCDYLGTTDKEDIYWSHDIEGQPVFRTRKECINGVPRILFTSKPLKNRDDKTEVNVENEFEVASAQWENIIEFVRGLGFLICRLKFKRGIHFQVTVNGFSIHAELLYVRHLGYFLEIEICTDDVKDVDVKDAEDALYKLLDLCGIQRSQVEAKGYNKMLTAIGRQRG